LSPRKLNVIKAVFFLLAPLIVVGCNGHSNSGGQTETPVSVTPFVPIHYKTIPLPGNVRPLYSSWSPDGDYIIFGNIFDGEIWTVNADGSDLECVTCGIKDLPEIYSAFGYVFPDGKRILFANELGSKVYVIECSPSVTACNDSHAYPVDLSADKAQGKIDVDRRTYHLAPDGIHLAYTKVRLDTLLMIVGRLEKVGDKYVLKDPKVINPPGPAGPSDHHAQGWANAAQLYEFKSFADGGKSALITAEGYGFEPNTFKMDLATGKITRMASSADWDEDGAISPDRQYFALASWRTMHRLEALGLMPLAKDFYGYPLTAVIAFYYVSNFTGFQCDLQPWLLPGDGDDNGKLIGQPLAPYKGNNIVAANNLVGQPMWSPDSTRILIREHLTRVPDADANDEVKVKGIPPNQLLIARLDRKPTQPKPAVKTVVGDWASTPAEYTGPFASDETASIQGSNRGTVHVKYKGNILDAQYSATYDHYSEDGKVFLSGTSSFSGNVQKSVDFKVNLKATDANGKTIGKQVGNLNFTFNPSATYTEQPWIKSGEIHTTYKGEKAAPLANAGPCIDSLPRPTPLIVTHEMHGDSLQIHVAADIQGDKRPVWHAQVTVNGDEKKTDKSGTATFHTSSSGSADVKVSAGDTFVPKELTVTMN
jgi:hypothetical protein